MSSKLLLTLFLSDSERSGQSALCGTCESACHYQPWVLGNHVNTSMATHVRQTPRSIKVFMTNIS